VTQAELIEKIDAFIALHKDAIVEDIAALVSIPSIQGPPEPGAPFGRGVRVALDEALSIARRMGLETHDGDGYVGWAELPGRQAGHLATITHVDVVPEGDGWDDYPFQLRQRGDWLIGRGVADDKGPGVLCLYAAWFLKELGIPLRYSLRVLLGCNEESGMEDLPHYFKHNPQPLFCFSPDTDFPVCNGEKGHFGGQFVSGPLQGSILEFNTGLAPNVIPGQAACLIDADPAALKPTAHVAITGENGKARLAATGIAGHAAKPEGTLNAIGLLVDYLLGNQLCSESENTFLALMRRIHMASDGAGLGVACQDDVFDALTVNGGVVSLENGRLSQSLDIRFPTATTGDALKTAMAAEAARHGAAFRPGRISEPFYIPASSPPVQVLMNVYNEVTGRTDKPYTMGGGTYAQHFACGVSYGSGDLANPLPSYCGPEHGANEGACLPDLLLALKIYILALWRLQDVDFD